MIIELTEDDVKFLGFHMACQLEDYEKSIKKNCKDAESKAAATAQLHRLEELIYTKFIPKSWCGPRPSYWSKIESKPVDNPFGLHKRDELD